MTGYTVHSGSNEKFADGWDRIFGGEKAEAPKAKKKGKSAGKKGGKKGKKSKRST